MKGSAVVHFGTRDTTYQAVINRYAATYGRPVVAYGRDTSMFQAADVVKYASFVFIWNGLQGQGALAARLCRRRGIPHAFFEQGLLPQATTYLFDRRGFCADSSLADDLSWVNQRDLDLLAEIRGELQATYTVTDEGFTLVPLQVENDTQILYYTGYRNMQEFVERLTDLIPEGPIVVRPHPKSSARREAIHPRVRIETSGTFLDWARRASRVVGLTSTALYESAILGKDVRALGDHPLRDNLNDRDRLLAGLLAQRVDRVTGDVAPIFERFGLRPLGCEPKEFDPCLIPQSRTASESTPSITRASPMPVGGPGPRAR